MAIQTVEELKSTLIGISFLKGEQNRSLKSVWEKRFQKDTLNAILIDDNKDIQDAGDKVLDKFDELNIKNITRNLIVAVFLDDSDSKKDSLLSGEELEDLRYDLEDMLNKNILEFIVFDNVGKYKRAYRRESEREVLREKIKEIALDNQRTFVVGQEALSSDDGLWKAEIAFLDLLARGSGDIHMHILPGIIGFLKYGESNQRERNRLMNRKRNLERLLSTEGEDDLRRCMELFEQEQLTSYLTERCKPVRGIQPIMEELLTRPTIFNRAEDAYNEALAKTNRAIHETEANIRDYMADRFSVVMENPDKIIRDLMAQCSAGLGLLENEGAKDRIFVIHRREKKAGNVNLIDKYTVAAIEEEIDRYLTNSYESELNRIHEKFVNAMRTVFNGFTKKEIESLRRQYEDELRVISERIQQLPATSTFCQEVMLGQHFESVFTPADSTVLARENKCLLFSGDEMLDFIRKQSFESVQAYFYDAMTGYESTEALSSFMFTEMSQMDRILCEIIQKRERGR